VLITCIKAFGHVSKLVQFFQLAGDDSDKKSRTFVFKEGGHTFGNALRCIISR
jgi:DNA-directed RNA polymerase subunit L